MRAFSVITLLAALVLPTLSIAEIQTFSATHTYIMGDHDSKDDARQRCLLEVKRKILEQAGVYIESASEVKNFDLTKDKITSFAAAVMQVKDTEEEVGFQQGHMTLTLKLNAQVDLGEVRKQLAARQVDASEREDVTAQKERLKRLEAQLEAMQRQIGNAPGQTPAPSPSGISAAEVQTLTALATQGNVDAQDRLGWMYAFAEGVPQDYPTARKWWGKAAAQGDLMAQSALGDLYADGRGGARDYAMARKWWEEAAAQGGPHAQFNLGVLYEKGHGVRQDFVQAHMWYTLGGANGNKKAAEFRDALAQKMTPAQVAEAQRLASRCQAQQFKGC
jgi:TPR repeat protein